MPDTPHPLDPPPWSQRARWRASGSEFLHPPILVGGLYHAPGIRLHILRRRIGFLPRDAPAQQPGLQPLGIPCPEEPRELGNADGRKPDPVDEYSIEILLEGEPRLPDRDHVHLVSDRSKASSLLEHARVVEEWIQNDGHDPATCWLGGVFDRILAGSRRCLHGPDGTMLLVIPVAVVHVHGGTAVAGVGSSPSPKGWRRSRIRSVERGEAVPSGRSPIPSVLRDGTPLPSDQ